jgi:site-specific DNA recombinase
MVNNNTEHVVRVAIYSRVSTAEQADSNTSLDFQNGQLTNYCHLQGWEIFQNYVDPGFTGKDGNRPALKRMLADAKLGLFNRVLVIKLDRLSRNLRLLLEIEETLKQSGVSVASIKESIDTSVAIGRTVFQVLGLVSEWERDNIIERTKAGRLQRYKEGKWAGGPVPFGYDYDRETKKLVINANEAIIVKRIFNEYINGGTLNGVASSLQRDHIPPRSTHSMGWRLNAVHNILLNPIYKGNQIVNRHCHIADIKKVDMTKAIEIAVPPIVSNDLWQKAQNRLSTNVHNKPAKRGEYLLQGLITCGLCGYVFKSDKNKDKRFYMCRGRMKDKHLDGSEKCKAPSFRADWLENEVNGRLKALIDDPNKLTQVIRNSINTLRLREEELNARIRPIDEQLGHINQQKSKLADDWIICNMDKVKYQEIRSTLDKEESRLKLIRSNIDPSQIAELEKTQVQLRLWENQLKDLSWNLENEDGSKIRSFDGPHNIAASAIRLDDDSLSAVVGFPTSPRQLLDLLQVKLVVFNDRIEVNALIPMQPIELQRFTSTSRREEEVA